MITFRSGIVRMINVSDKSFRESKNTHFIFKNFIFYFFYFIFENRA